MHCRQRTCWTKRRILSRCGRCIVPSPDRPGIVFLDVEHFETVVWKKLTNDFSLLVLVCGKYSIVKGAVFSLIIPVYRNEGSCSSAFRSCLYVDGSPDRSAELLASALPEAEFLSQLVVLSRNFGVFAAITAGLASARGQLFATMSADLQEPPELILEIREKLRSGKYDVVVGTRAKREDPIISRMLSAGFWKLYRVLIRRDLPAGGVDMFGCTREFKDHLLALREHNTTLIGLIFWLGFRRGQVSYSRRRRTHGKSAWSFARKLRYLLDSTFAFSDLPIRLLSFLGITGMSLSLVIAVIVLFNKWTGRIEVPGYTATVLLIMFFGGLNSLGLGLIGEYMWRTFENTKGRPEYIIAQQREFKKA